MKLQEVRKLSLYFFCFFDIKDNEGMYDFKVW